MLRTGHRSGSRQIGYEKRGRCDGKAESSPYAAKPTPERSLLW